MRSRLVVVVLCLLVVLPAAAAVTGYIETTDGQPIAGAKVELFAIDSQEAANARLLSKSPDRVPLVSGATDAKGKITLESPKEAVVNLRVLAPGYAPASTRIERDEDFGAIALVRAESKSGRVTAGGKPLPGARLVWSGAGETIVTTDEQGRYSVPDPAKWASEVTVIHPDYALDDEMQGRRSMLPVLDRTLNPGTPLSGKVVAGDGATPVAGATILLDNWPLATSGEDGTFTIAHAPNQWQLLVVKSGNLAGTRARGSASTTVKLGKTGTLTGSVRDAKTAAPLAGADVRVFNTMRIADRWVGLTDAKGNFTITGIAPGSYSIAVMRPGYHVPPASTSITAGQTANKPLSGTELARVNGTVLDEEKRPVAAARVNSQAVRQNEPFVVMFQGVNVPASVSAPDGSFAVRAAPDADVHVGAARKGYPSAKDVTLHLRPGERKTGVVLTIPNGFAVTGKVADKDGKPVAGVSVTAGESGPYSVNRMVFIGRPDRNDDVVKTGSDGTFTIRLKEGTWDLSFRREGFAPKVVRALEVKSSVRPIDITLEPGVEITGRVTRNGTGIDGVRVMARSESAQATEITGPDGSFRLTDLPPGTMIVSAFKTDDFIQENRTVTAPAQGVNIEIPAGVRLSGRVVDKATKQPVTTFDAGISRSPSGQAGMMAPPNMRHFTADDGTFVLEHVPAGQAQVVVNASGYTTARLSNMTIEEGKNVSDLEVAMDHGVRVVGHVTDPGRSALPNVTVGIDASAGRMMQMPNRGPMVTTDSNGDYTFEALEAGDKTFIFSLAGYETTSKKATLSPSETRVDAQLSTGMRVYGTVATESGVPVAEARVFAMSGVQSALGSRGATTDANGNFSIEALSPGRYNFSAQKTGYASGRVTDFDITTGAPVRLVLKTGGVIYGHVTGLSSDDLLQATVTATSYPNGSASGPVDSSGNYRIEGVPAGTARVSARAGMGMLNGKTSPVQSVQVDSGSPVQVDIQFKNDTVVSGRITRNGNPVDGAIVSFSPADAIAQTSARTTSGNGGQYQVSGLDDATYNVIVSDVQRPAGFRTKYPVHGSGTFDIEMRSAMLRGRVIDTGGNPIPDAIIEVRERADDTGTGVFTTVRIIQTDASGMFLADSISPGKYGISASKEGYGTKAVDTTVDDSGGQVEITLAENAGVTLKVVDARDGRTLNARVHVASSSGAPVYDSPFFGGVTADVIKLPLDPGTYRATIFAMGYAPQTVTITSPSSPTIGLTPGGTILVRSKASTMRTVRLMGPDGKWYATHLVDPSPGVTTLPNIAPGTYTMQILGAKGEVTASAPVTVLEGQTVTVDL